MDITPYKITYQYGDALSPAEVHPCCDQNNVVDYAIYINGQLAFNITKPDETGRWVVSLKNADKDIDDEIVQHIGIEIERHNKE